MHVITPVQLVRLLPLGFVGLVSWSVWLYRWTCSHRARPFRSGYRTTASVVVPVFHEDPTVLADCLATWVAADPLEVVLVVDLDDRPCLDMLAAATLPTSVRVIPFRHDGKRSALGVGIRAARGEVVVLADSDTAWTGTLLERVLEPFVDPRVGGVGTRQVVAARDSSVWRRVASWLLNTRYHDYVPAMSRRGAVACLSGRTVAYRREVVTPLLPDLEHETFLGRQCVAGDDGRLTWLVLAAGYRTVHQPDAVAVSMFPATLQAFAKQRVRWSRNSYRCYLTAAVRRWLWHQPMVTQVTVLQILLTPVTMTTNVVALALALDRSGPLVAAGYVGWLLAGRALRGASHLREHPRDILLLPLVVLVVATVAAPVKLWALVTMNRQGWLTRTAGGVGGEGQDTASLAGGAVHAT